uniref:Uncharacterized protein n=1 Tax=Rhizobium meliloti TaxID=382 RepID=I2E1U3_RHIML|nr:short hypothetical protein [Sinorhizobium meliloti]
MRLHVGHVTPPTAHHMLPIKCCVVRLLADAISWAVTFQADGTRKALLAS